MLPELAALLLQATLQERIDRTPSGGLLSLPAGVYREHVRIGKPLTIDGGDGAILDGGGRGTIVSVTDAAVVLRRLTIRGSGDSFSEEDAGVRLENASGSRIEDCRLEDVLFGLYISQSSGCFFRRLKIGGKALPMPRRGDGVRLWYSHDTLLEQIEMTDSRDFIIWFARGTQVRDCRIVRSRYGLHYMNCDDNEFVGNVFSDNQVGGTIMYSRRIRMKNNRFERSRGPSAYGMLLKDADDVLAEDNVFVDNTRGIFFDNSPSQENASCTIRRNVFALNDAGVSILPDTRRVRFEANTFVDNLAHVEFLGRVDSRKNLWEGNYWGDHPAYDADGDGFSEIPYRPESVYESLTSAHPELAFLRFSPSILAIERAGRIFPSSAGELQLEDARPSVRPTVARRDPGARFHPDMMLLTFAFTFIPLGAAFWAWRSLR